MEVPVWLWLLGSWLGITWGFQRLFKEAGETVNQDTRSAVANWLLNIEEIKPANAWASHFTSLFDKVFVGNIFSQTFLIASFFNSLIFVIVLFMLFKGFGAEIYSSYSRESPELLVLLFAINYVPDLLSLIATRIVLDGMERSNSLVEQLLLLFVDIAFTIGIIVVAIMICLIPSYILLPTTSLEDTFNFIRDFYLGETLYGNLPVIFLLTTFFSSIWVWLYLLAGFTMKIINTSIFGIKLTRKYLSVETYPFRSMGLMLTIIITIIYIAVAISMII